ncbi:unnamed protein product [Vicia faba]|uniref:Uncharacterized protein n=1 Tax=Vicia faba TaxID=3906 RepID=A0AAV1BBH3_VICFA|nr:unnamed protein product [Vicia faba]
MNSTFQFSFYYKANNNLAQIRDFSLPETTTHQSQFLFVIHALFALSRSSSNQQISNKKQQYYNKQFRETNMGAKIIGEKYLSDSLLWDSRRGVSAMMVISVFGLNVGDTFLFASDVVVAFLICRLIVIGVV